MSFASEVEGATNGLRFETRQEATEYGNDLWDRWLGCPTHPEPIESTDPVSHVWKEGKLRRIEQDPDEGRTPARSVQL